MHIDMGKAFESFPYLLQGLKFTILIAFFGLMFGYVIGLIAGLARTSRNKLVFGIATVYVEAIRGTPLLVQAVWLYFGVNQLLVQTLGFRVSSQNAGIIVIAINCGAYIAEIVRGSIESIDKGQVEAGRSLGLSGWQTFRYIVFPQAFKRMIPPLGNQFIISLKDTSLLSIIAVPEMMRASQEVVSVDFDAFEVYTLAALMYLALTLFISLILRQVERRLGESHDRSRTAAKKLRRAGSVKRDRLPDLGK